MRRFNRNRFSIALAVVLILCVLLLGSENGARAHPAQNTQVQLSVDAGFDGYYRANQWMPLLVSLSNTGPDLSGELHVTALGTSGLPSGEYVTNIDLPKQSKKQVFVYITLNRAQQVKVELATQTGVIAVDAIDVKLAPPGEPIYAVITESPRGTVDLQPAHTATGVAHQVNWNISNVPDSEEALQGLDLLLLTDVDSGNLTLNQRQAITNWVRDGGHLVVTGGPNWQKTQAGVSELLPLKPTGSTTLTSLPTLAVYSGRPSDSLDAPQDTPIIVAQGDLTADAVVLASDSDTPLLIRHPYGGGTVDYLSIDPGIEPISSWQNRDQLWLTLITNAGQQPSWTDGVISDDVAQQAADLIAGLRLPDVAQLAGFLFVYILVIGPLNYLVLRRIGRRELAWVTIPIIVFASSVVAFLTGLSLRGTEATVNRIALVQVWPGSDQAHVDGVIGLLAPRRSTYALIAHDGLTLRTLSDPTNVTALSANSAPPIHEFPNYEVHDIAIDAGLTATFATSGSVVAKPIDGSAVITLSSQQATPLQNPLTITGTVTNTTGQVLQDAVILVSGASQQIGTLGIGESAKFSINLGATVPSAPQSFGTRLTSRNAISQVLQSAYFGVDQTVHDILGPNYVDGYGNTVAYNFGYGNNPEQQEQRRRAAFLRSITIDGDSSGGRGGGVYLVGWTATSPLNVDLEGASFATEDTSLYIYKLPVTVHSAIDQPVEIPPALMTWTVTKDTTQRRATPYQLNVQQGQIAVFRYSPLPGILLDKVTELKLFAQAQNQADGVVSLWNWHTGTWDEIIVSSAITSVSDPTRYVGPQNAVQVQIKAAPANFLATYDRVDVILYGTRQAAP